MDFYNHPTAPANRFTDGDPLLGTPATRLQASWFNAITDELVRVITEAGLSPNAADLTQVAQGIRILGSGGGGIKNAVINGDFAIWQRGQTFSGITATPRYTADRWEVRADGTGGAGVATVSRQGFATGQADVLGARFFLRYSQTTGSNAGGGSVRTKIEGIESFAGRQVTVSVSLRASGSITVGLDLVNQLTGSGTALVGSQSLSVTTSWQRFTRTFTLPSIAGETLDAALAHLRLELKLPAGTPQLDIARVQLERAALPSAFEERSDSLELTLCQRYYVTSYEPGVAPGTANVIPGAVTGVDGSDQIESMQTRFPQAMRATPTITWYSPVTGQANTIAQPTGNVTHTVTGNMHPSRTATGWPRIGQTLTTEPLTLAHFTADADL